MFLDLQGLTQPRHDLSYARPKSTGRPHPRLQPLKVEGDDSSPLRFRKTSLSPGTSLSYRRIVNRACVTKVSTISSRRYRHESELSTKRTPISCATFLAAGTTSRPAPPSAPKQQPSSLTALTRPPLSMLVEKAPGYSEYFELVRENQSSLEFRFHPEVSAAAHRVDRMVEIDRRREACSGRDSN
jgi:hypothetical protein